MELKKMNRLYDYIIELQKDLENMVAIAIQDEGWYLDVKALAAAYELQDYLASVIAIENEKSKEKRR